MAGWLKLSCQDIFVQAGNKVPTVKAPGTEKRTTFFPFQSFVDNAVAKIKIISWRVL
jgi:hypothetical protein